MNDSLQFSRILETVFTPSDIEEERLDFGTLVKDYYASLYRFALSLSQNEANASDLTQQTFYLWATKGHQLRDFSKIKSWLFTTLRRGFLNSRRHETRFPHHEIDSVDTELPQITSDIVSQMDGVAVMQALMQVEERCRVPLTLFYLENHSYREMAEILNAPIGTVMSRISRGKQRLRRILAEANKKIDKNLNHQMKGNNHE